MLEKKCLFKSHIKSKCYFNRKIFTSEALSHFSVEWPCRKTSCCIYYSRWSEDWQLSRKAAHHFDPRVRTCGQHQYWPNTFQRITMFEPLSLSLLHTAPSSMTITQYFSIGTVHHIWKYFTSEQGAFISIGQQKCMMATPSMTFLRRSCLIQHQYESQFHCIHAVLP